MYADFVLHTLFFFGLVFVLSFFKEIFPEEEWLKRYYVLYFLHNELFLTSTNAILYYTEGFNLLSTTGGDYRPFFWLCKPDSREKS